MGAVVKGPSSNMWSCPGSTALKDPTLEIIKCPFCGEENEIFSDEMRIACSRCGKNVARNFGASCIDWCSKAEECLGAELVAKYKGSKE